MGRNETLIHAPIQTNPEKTMLSKTDHMLCDSSHMTVHNREAHRLGSKLVVAWSWERHMESKP